MVTIDPRLLNRLVELRVPPHNLRVPPALDRLDRKHCQIGHRCIPVWSQCRQHRSENGVNDFLAAATLVLDVGGVFW